MRNEEHMDKRTITGTQILDAQAAIAWALNYNEATPGSIKPV